MNEKSTDIKSVVVKIITDKPVRKTPYQVKGVFMRQYPDEPIIPMLDGSYRDKFLYPRVQVKILNEQIYIIGIHEGVDTILSATKKFKQFDFGNITFTVQDYDIERLNNQFIPSDRPLRYRFITPWVALNHMTGGKYRLLSNKEKPSYLNKLLGQNLIFLANEVGINIEKEIFSKVKVKSLFPKPIDENKWGAFRGEFKTNFVLPNYIGVGNGITRGFGTIYSMFNPESFSFDETQLKKDVKSQAEETINDKEMEKISVSDVPKPKRKRLQTKYNKGKKNKGKSFQADQSYKRGKNYHKRKRSKSKEKGHSNNYRFRKSGNIFSEEYDIEEVNNINKEGSKDDQRFNTEQHHKKQHKF